MATSTKAGQSSNKNPSRRIKGDGHTHTYGGQLDLVAPKDTRYPDLKNPMAKRGLRPGNGPTPGNPFGKHIKKPNIG